MMTEWKRHKRIEEMNNNKNTTSGGGIGFWGLLTIVFITLKLLGYINWSWWWVLAPLWISICLYAALILIFLIVKR